jgi:hypothetical protein
MKAQYPQPSDLAGYKNLRSEDRIRITMAWKDGHVNPEDIPLTARKDDIDKAAEDKLRKRACALFLAIGSMIVINLSVQPNRRRMLKEMMMNPL